MFFNRTQTATDSGSSAKPKGLIWTVFTSLIFAWSLVLLSPPPALWASEQLTRIIEAEAAILQQGLASQNRINDLDEATTKLLHEYRNLLRQQENLAIYNDNLEQMIRSQQAEMVALDQQIKDIEVSQREILPMVLRMVDTLADFVSADIPFLAEERKARVEGLRALMVRADVSIPEKFRRVMLAYQAEVDFGRTIEVYQGKLVLAGRDEDSARVVEFLRVGRLALIYQTLDRRESGFWDPHRQTWIPLARRHNRAIHQSLRVAARQAAPKLIRVPLVISENRPVIPGDQGGQPMSSEAQLAILGDQSVSSANRLMILENQLMIPEGRQ